MKEIKLTQGKVALVDDEDFEYLNQWKWFFTGKYAARMSSRIAGQRFTIWMHREINNTKEGLDTDHINGNRLDNRKRNLRNSTRQQNQFNRKTNKNNKSGNRGVYWDSKRVKWVAFTRYNYRNIIIGRFADKSSAILAYNSFIKSLHGNFARVNEIY